MKETQAIVIIGYEKNLYVNNDRGILSKFQNTVKHS